MLPYRVERYVISEVHSTCTNSLHKRFHKLAHNPSIYCKYCICTIWVRATHVYSNMLTQLCLQLALHVYSVPMSVTTWKYANMFLALRKLAKSVAGVWRSAGLDTRPPSNLCAPHSVLMDWGRPLLISILAFPLVCLTLHLLHAVV